MLASEQVLGGWRFSKDNYSGTYAIGLGVFWNPVIWSTIAAVIVSPALVLTGLIIAVRNRAKDPRGKRLFAAVLLFLIVALVVSMGSCVWSCGGHPTWSSGYK
jgi:ABC-type sugar transport system permease subunit